MSGLILALLAFAAATAVAQEAPSVVVTGEAVVRRAPDRAFVTVASEARAKNPRDAQMQNADAMTAVQNRLAQAGVPKEAIRTFGVDLEQEFDVQQGRRVFREYAARNAIEVRVDDLARVGELLDLAVQTGATSIGGIRFDLRDRASAERDALRLAVEDARARADAAAAGAGRTIDRIVKVEEAREGPTVVARPMMMARADASAATPVEPGVVEIRARVTLTASIK